MKKLPEFIYQNEDILIVWLVVIEEISNDQLLDKRNTRIV